jgi:hypothetical protein
MDKMISISEVGRLLEVTPRTLIIFFEAADGILRVN